MAWEQDVIQAYETGRATRMGSFPLPSRSVVIACDVLNAGLGPQSRSYTINVVELVTRRELVYLVANSGTWDLKKEVGDAGPLNEALRTALGTRSCRFVFARIFDYLYEPLHADLQALLRRVRADFAPERNPIRRSDVQAVVTRVETHARQLQEEKEQKPLHELPEKAKPGVMKGLMPKHDAVFGSYYDHGASGDAPGVPQMYEFGPTVKALARQDRLALSSSPEALDAVRDLLTCAASLRVQQCEPTEAAVVRRDLDAAARHLRTSAFQGEAKSQLEKLATHVETLTHLKPAGELTAPPDVPGPHGKAVKKIWELLGQSRGCAEPQACVYLRAGAMNEHSEIQGGTILSQACIWIVADTNGLPNPTEYRVYGPRAKPGDSSVRGSFMWPCSSCLANSGKMMDGFAVADVATRTRLLREVMGA